MDIIRTSAATAAAARLSPKNAGGFVFARGLYKRTPNTPTGGQYKTNVNRTKTKKWVEAKVQSYDGDDWGADEYDDEPPEDEVPPPPPPPPKPLGPRLPGSNPSSQPPTPQSAVHSIHSGKPYSASASPAPSPGLKGPSGPPALQIQTQAQSQSPTVAPENPRPDHAGPSNAPAPITAPSGASAEQVASPQSAGVPQSGATASSVYSQPSARNVSSPVTDRRMSPAPQSASGPVPTRFPPRKSSMGQQAAPDLSEIVRPGSGPDLVQGKPWREGRPASPLGPRSPDGQPNKPSFIRPADIYKRMGEEKEKERLSMDSNRPSLDSLGARGSERSSSPLKTDSDQRPASFGRDEDGADRTRSANQVLTPVAERKSEHGFDGMVSGAQQPNVSEGPKPVIGADEDGDLRRFSTSPKLPDLARMSLFGEDLFSNPSGFLADAPPMPTIPDRDSESPEQETPSISKKPVVLPTQAASDTSSEASAKEGGLKLAQTTSSDRKSLDAAKAVESKDVVDTTTTSAADVLAPPRPSLPGKWVTETGATPGETPGEPSKDLSGIGAPSAARDADTANPPGARQVQAGDIGTDESSDDDDGLTSTRSPDALPPINTSSRPAPAVEDKAIMPPPVLAESTKPQAQDATPTTATSEVPPTAPLNTRRSEIFPSDYVPPQSLERISTMSTTTNSPVKESDKLREEIIRTLSPVKASDDFAEASAARDAGLAGRNTTRESTYLNDVYGDYWSAEDRPEDEALEGTALETVDEAESEKSSEPATALREAAPAVPPPTETKPEVAAIPVLSPPVLSPPALNPQSPQRDQVPQPEPQKLTLGRQRFSWEMDTEETAAPQQPAPPAQQDPAEHEPKSLGIGPSSMTPPAGSPTEQGASQIQAARDPEDLSPKISLLSSAAPGPGVGPDQLSPVSAMTEQKSPPLSTEPHRLSLADEKSQIQHGSSLVSPAPPPYEHPALSKGSSTPQSAASPVTAAPPTDLDRIVTFRQIMSYPTPAERIATYEETRRQFAEANSGLADWLGGMRSQPEHAGASASMREAVVAALVSPTAAGGAGAESLPYFQQYLNASSPTTAAAGPSGPRPATAGGHLHHGHGNAASQFGPSSEFRHSSGQAAAKSKEFLQTAGKMSKGLFNKGKNKLRAL
ncbi:uncharacterized protein E0L32_010700 [Thyridium curvatum]|uniref:Uncharacterized protein n=1 Tax=Thyridium curvatum TaxID=1093900 RepID=A0A507ART3_9PEZI|nr:uncharacterized protein E0L32_010700 [Thyridium curvatum]TPX07601.1 hypothetical protein E0L32_010700 [Thyridium curvatum]